MFTKAIREGMLKVRYSVKDFMALLPWVRLLGAVPAVVAFPGTRRRTYTRAPR
jgi:hypothetical protein